MFNQVIVLLLVISLPSTHCSVEDLNDGRIVGGKPTSIWHAPYQVSLQLSKHFCGGAIYSKEIIVTAAHCVHQKDYRLIKVRAGSSLLYEHGALKNVSGMLVHELFSKHHMTNDLALLLLSSELKLDMYTKPISLAMIEPKSNAIAMITGWGRNLPHRNGRDYLHSVFVQVMSKNQCAKQYAKYKIEDVSLCAAAPGKDACQGDSGGPLVYKSHLIGVVSWGIGCARPKYPGVYANVAVLRNWIVRAASVLKYNKTKHFIKG